MSGRSDAPKVIRRQFWPTLWLAVLSGTLAVIGLLNERWVVAQANLAAPGGGAYWAVSQYQIAHHRLKQELRAIAAGETADLNELNKWTAVSASRSSILTEPSEFRSHLNGVTGYSDAAKQVRALQQGIGPLLDKVPFLQGNAQSVLRQMSSIDDDELLGRLSSEVRSADIAVREATLHELTVRLRWLWAALALCWLVLAMWLMYAVSARRRFAAVALDRQIAVDAMGQALIAKRKFLSMVNHEVRSPLQNIVAAAEVLASAVQQPGQLVAVRRIQRAVALLQGQLRDLLTVARSDEDSLPMQKETFDFALLVRDVCADLNETATGKGLSFRLQLPDLPLIVTADPLRIAQVLRNLVENAVRYTRVGEVTVVLEALSAQPADISAQPADGPPRSPTVAHITIQDTGPGLPAESLTHLHGVAVPFRPSLDGSGIGLLVVRDVMQQLGGKLVISSTGADGTTIAVTFPVKSVEAASAEPTVDAALRVLIVDDRQEVLAALTDMTHRLGHACTPTNSAADALNLVSLRTYDVVLIDFLMPDMNGLALATEIRQRPGPNVSSMLILISAAENHSVGQAWPFDGFLQKPIDAGELKRLIGSKTPR